MRRLDSPISLLIVEKVIPLRRFALFSLKAQTVLTIQYIRHAGQSPFSGRGRRKSAETAPLTDCEKTDWIWR